MEMEMEIKWSIQHREGNDNRSGNDKEKSDKGNGKNGNRSGKNGNGYIHINQFGQNRFVQQRFEFFLQPKTYNPSKGCAENESVFSNSTAQIT